MPLPNIYLRFKSPIILHPFLILTHQSKPICSSPSLVQLTPPTHHHIAQLIKDQKSATQAIQTFKWASKLPNFSHNQSTYRALIQKLCTFRCFDYAHQVVDEMSSSIGSNPDEDIFVTMIRGLGKARRIREVIRVLDLMHKFDCIPSLKIYNCILDVLVQEDIDIAKGFFRKKMMECGVKGDDYTYGILMKGLCLTNRIGDGFKLLQVMKIHRWNPNTTVYNTLIHALCKNGKVGRARSLMSEMIEPNDVTYNIMISAYCSEESLVQAQVLLEKSFGSGFVPDVVTVTKVIDLLCKLGRANEAAEVLDRVENNGGLVDIVAYNTLIKGFCSIGKAKVGLHFKKQMENKGCLPNVDTYNALIAGFCDIDMLDYALDLFNEMKMEAVDCNFVTYDTLIKGFCFKGQVEDGFKILEIMEESKDGSGGRISPYNSIIYGLYCEKCLDEALDFLDKMRKMFPRAVDRTMKILHFCEEGNMESAKKVYDKMVHEGGNPSVLVYTTLIHGFCQHEHIREAFELMNEMVSHGYFHVTSTYTAVISGFCGHGKIVGALKLVEDLVARGCSIDVGTYGPVIYALCSQGDLNKALKIFQQMVGKGIEPDSSTWTSLLYCLSQENSLLQTENILHVNNIVQQIIET